MRESSRATSLHEMILVASQLVPTRIAGPASREAALVTFCDDEHLEGTGELAPIAGFSPESLDQSIHAVNAICKNIHTVDESLAPLIAVDRALAPHARLLDACPTARFALETALLHLLAQRRGEDLATCIRGAPLALASLETSALLYDPAGVAPFVERALAAIARRHRALKVKLRASDDASLDREIEGLTALRRVAPDIELRLDPNGRWSIAAARRFLGELAPLAPAFVEQPVAPHDLADLGPCAVPWAADESLVPSSAQLDRFTRENGCAAFVLKPAALGVARALSLAALARARGLAPIFTHFLDGPIGFAAARATALSLDPPLPACGLAPHEGLRPLAPSTEPSWIR